MSQPIILTDVPPDSLTARAEGRRAAQADCNAIVEAGRRELAMKKLAYEADLRAAKLAAARSTRTTKWVGGVLAALVAAPLLWATVLSPAPARLALGDTIAAVDHTHAAPEIADAPEALPTATHADTVQPVAPVVAPTKPVKPRVRPTTTTTTTTPACNEWDPLCGQLH